MKKLPRLPCEPDVSPIHGFGGFAIRNIAKGELFDNDDYNGTLRGFNHCDTPNLRLVWNKRGIRFLPTGHTMVALKDIKRGEEITVRYPFDVPPDWK